MIYFVTVIDHGPIKIGCTRFLDARLRWLSRKESAPVRVVALAPGGRKEEAALHRKFSDLRMYGEWFSPAPILVSFIKANKERWSIDLDAANARDRQRMIQLWAQYE